MDTASSWDSYRETMVSMMELLKPKRVLEFGIGRSTDLILSFDYVESLDSVEHNPKWIEKCQQVGNPKLHVIFEPRIDIYPLVSGRFDKYDMIFVDGIERERCLDFARYHLSDKGFIILHDSERPQYRDAIESYDYIDFRDGGHTVIVANRLIPELARAE